jgi:hypothetical protein
MAAVRDGRMCGVPERVSTRFRALRSAVTDHPDIWSTSGMPRVLTDSAIDGVWGREGISSRRRLMR